MPSIKWDFPDPMEQFGPDLLPDTTDDSTVGYCKTQTQVLWMKESPQPF